jgi:hypothetical protein
MNQIPNEIFYIETNIKTERPLHLTFIHDIAQLHVHILASDILCPAHGHQAQKER